MEIKVIKIPFATRPKSKYKIEGDAYYLIDSNFDVVNQFIQIHKANYRPTDSKMIKTDYYSKNSLKIKIRNIHLKNIDSLNEKTIPLYLTPYEIFLLNKDLLKMSRVKSSIDILTGSNSSGAKSCPSKSDIIYNDKNDKSLWCNGMNFSNPLNDLRIYNYVNVSKKYIFNSLEELKQFKIISIPEIVENPNYFKINYQLKRYNTFIFFIEKNPDILLKYGKNSAFSNLDEEIQKEMRLVKYKKGTNNYYWDNIENIIQSYKENYIDIKSCKNKLRNIQKALLYNQIRKLSEETDDLSMNFIYDDVEANITLEHAHIVSVKWSADNDELYKIADPDNCIVLSPNWHKRFDNNYITFNKKGEVVNAKNEMSIISFIKEKYLNEKRCSYIEENYIYFSCNNTNK